MLPTHTPNAPRHARIFELLRQKELAELTTERLQDPVRLQDSLDVAHQLKKNAMKSFEAPMIERVPARLF